MSEENVQSNEVVESQESQSADDVSITETIGEMDQKLQDAQSEVEGQEELSEEVEEEKVEAVEEAIKDLKRKIRLKVDGEEFDEEIDLNDEDYLRKQLQLAKVSQKRMNEYASLEKEVRQFIDALKSDPKSVLSDPTLGLDLKKLAQSVIEEEIENSKKSPEQIEKEKLEAKLRALEDERKQEKEEQQRKEFERLEQQAAERYDVMMTKALEESNLPKTPYIVKKIADYMYLGIQEGIDVTPSDVIPLVTEEVQNDIKQMFSVMPEDTVEQLIGNEVLGKLRKRRLAKAKPAPKSLKTEDTGASDKPAQTDAQKRKTFKEFFGV